MLDSCTVTNADFMFGIQGTNNTLTLQNGACLYARAYRLTTPGAVATTHYTNNMIFVKGESSLLWGNSDFAFDYGGSTDEKTHSAMYVSGRSVLKSIGGSASFILGLSSSGNEVYVDGGSRLEVPRGVTIGNADNAKYNVMTVSGKSAVTNGYSLTIGSANGADHNRLEFLDSEYYGGEYNGIYVGEKGSFNELVVSNSAIKRCWFCCAGFDAAASNNTVRFVGPNASIGGSRYNMILFGSGHHNKFVLDGASIGRESSDCYFASSGGDSDEIASISNELQVANGGVFSEKSMKMHEGSVGNRIFVGASSAIRTAGDLNVRGRDNRVVVSNGTLYVSQSGSSMRFGKSTNDVDETGNMLVLQGTSPKVARIDPNNNYPSQFYNGSVLRFEVPPAGYEGVVFDRVEVKMYGTARLEFTGVEECHRTIFSSQDYQLSSSPFTILDFEGQDVTDSALETVSATLPAGCRVYRNASKHLHLKVKGNRGFHIIFR
jgi:hypothetical protein